jgi:beta-galactosidase
MKFSKILFAAAMSAISLSLSAETVSYTINSAWQFRRGDAPEGQWLTVDVPHTWNAQDVDDDTPGYYRDKGFYKKTIMIPSYAEGKRVYLKFEGVGQECDVLVNGKKVVSHVGSYSAFAADITDAVTAGKECEIVVNADNKHNPSIPPLSADFNFYGGIYRDVNLIVKEPVNISILDKATSGLYITTPAVSEEAAKVSARLLLNNTLAQTAKVNVDYEIYDPQGNLLQTISKKHKLEAGAGGLEVTVDADIAQPQLWSPDTPALYTLKALLKDPKTGEVYDQVAEHFGLRWFHFDADKGFFLNGKHLKLIGTNRHQDFKNKGWALDDSYHINDMRMLKEMGGNFLRVAHYPQDPMILAACDKLGILTSVEIPIVNAVTETQEFSDNCVLMVEEMVKQSFNHPSVIIWAYMNEVMLRLPYKRNTPEYKSYCEEVHRQAVRLENKINELDPARETLIPYHSGLDRYEDADLVRVPSTIGMNYYFGWYSRTVDYLQVAVDNFHKKYPDVPLMITEYGADIDQRIHSLKQPEGFDYSVEYGDFFQEHYLKTFLNTPHVVGCFLWNLNEFYSEPRCSAVPHVNLKGVITLDRKPKNTYLLYKANLTKEPFIKFADSDWTVRSGEAADKHRIKLYSNCESAVLYQEGEKVADLIFKMGTAEAYLPFKDGMNQFYAMAKDGKAVDVLNINYRAQNPVLKDGFTELNVLLGSNRNFTEFDQRVCWVHDKEYTPGSWGYVGGYMYRPKSGNNTLPAAEINLHGTPNDPMYQTQRRGIEAFKADVPDGMYSVYLHWAELIKPMADILIYNLGRNSVLEQSSDRTFSVAVNGKCIYEKLNVLEAVGPARPLVVKVDVKVENGEGLTIDLKPITGETMLTAVRIVKID